MEFRDLKRQYQVLKLDIDEAIQSVLSSGSFIMGKQVVELEEKLAEYVGVKHCVSCANGTDALVLALKVLGIGEGDVVFVPDFTFFASAEAVSVVGAVPVFVDVDSETFNLDTKDLEEKINYVKALGSYNLKAIMAVDLFGLPAMYDEICSIAKINGLYVVEDAAQGFGGRIGDRKACSFGDISTTSFFPAKPLGCYGDGGALFTNNTAWAEKAMSYRMHGKGESKYDNVTIGMNSRLDALQAAVLQVKLNAFIQNELEAVNNVAKMYMEELQHCVHIPRVPNNFYSSWAQFTITLETEKLRDSLQLFLKNKGVPTAVYYPKPLSSQPVYAQMSLPSTSTPVANDLCKRVLSLPMHPYLTEQEVQFICSSIKEWKITML